MAPVPLLVQFLIGYLATIVMETPVLLVGLNRRHSLQAKLIAGVWLTACTYPVVWFVCSAIFDPATDRGRYLLIAETFAPAAECVIFWAAFIRGTPKQTWATVRDLAAITVANLVSFGVGELVYWLASRGNEAV